MNSIHRLGAAIATLAAVATVAGSLFVQGYSTAQQAVAAAAATNAASSPTSTLGPEIVYVNPLPAAQVVSVTQTQPPGPPPVIHVVVPSVGGDDGGTDN
jgi:hypothetical protein